VKGYASHERKLFEDVTAKRMQALAAGNNPRERGVAESRLTQPVGRIMALAEDYPDLKASGTGVKCQNTDYTLKPRRRADGFQNA